MEGQNPFDFILQELMRQNKAKGFAGAPEPASPLLMGVLNALSFPAKALADFKERTTAEGMRVKGLPTDMPQYPSAYPMDARTALGTLVSAILSNAYNNSQDIKMRPFPGGGATVAKIPENMIPGWNYSGIPPGQR